MIDNLITIDTSSQIPVYKQIIEQITNKIQTGEYAAGELLPSMNELSDQLEISKETVKKVYSILRKRELIEATQGKGFFVSDRTKNRKLKILLLFDKISTYKQVLYDSFAQQMDKHADTTIRLHNQDIDVFEDFIDENLDMYDYYVITPHFPLDASIQKRVAKAISRIPNRKLILLDKNLENLSGNYGAAYQDFHRDVYEGLMQGLKKIKKYAKLNVATSPSSMYAPFIKEGIERFGKDNNIEIEYHSTISPEIIHNKELYLILNSQLDEGLIQLIRYAKELKLKIGKDIGIISYNESPINEIILDGLTTISTDFKQMGELAAKMILEKNPRKIKCDFKLIKRNTF